MPIHTSFKLLVTTFEKISHNISYYCLTFVRFVVCSISLRHGKISKCKTCGPYGIDLQTWFPAIKEYCHLKCLVKHIKDVLKGIDLFSPTSVCLHGLCQINLNLKKCLQNAIMNFFHAYSLNTSCSWVVRIRASHNLETRRSWFPL